MEGLFGATVVALLEECAGQEIGQLGATPVLFRQTVQGMNGVAGLGLSLGQMEVDTRQLTENGIFVHFLEFLVLFRRQINPIELEMNLQGQQGRFQAATTNTILHQSRQCFLGLAGFQQDLGGCETDGRISTVLVARRVRSTS